MVQKILRLIRGEVINLHAAAYAVASLTLLAQIVALFRDRLFAFSFGAGPFLDAYYAAFKIPDTIFALIASLVSAYVLIPFLLSAEKQSHKAARSLLADATTFFLVSVGSISLIVFFFTKDILSLLYPTLVHSSLGNDFVLLTQVLLFQPILLGLSSIFASVTQTEKRFFLFALSPVLYNFGIIIGAYFFVPTFGLIGLGFGVILGALLHLAIHVPVVLHARLMPYIRIPDTARLRNIIIHSLPRALALSMNTFTLIAVTIIAAQLTTGSITIFNFAYNLQNIPLSLIGASYAVVAFPTLAALYAKNHITTFVTRVSDAARHLIVWSMLAFVLFIVLRAHIVRTVLGTGSFSWDDTRLTAAVLAVLVSALIVQGLILLIARAYYASGHTFIPLIIQSIGGAVSIASMIFFIRLYTAFPAVQFFIESLFRISYIDGTSIIALALGLVFGQFVAGILALIIFSRMYKGFWENIAPALTKGLAAAVLSGASAYLALQFMGGMFALTSLAAVFVQALVAGILGLVVFLFMLYTLGSREFNEMYAAVHNFQKRRLEPQSEI